MTPKVPVGTATVAGLGTSTAAYGLAIANYLAGDRSQETYAALAVGTIALVTTLAGRFAQAVQHIKKPAPAPVEVKALHPADPRTKASVLSALGGTLTTDTEPGDPDALPDMLSTPPDVAEPDGDDRKVAA